MQIDFLLSETRRAPSQPGLVRFVYEPEPHYYEARSSDIYALCGTFRANVRTPGTYHHTHLNAFLKADPARQQPMHWRVHAALGEGTTFSEWPAMPRLNGVRGRPRVRVPGVPKALSPLAAMAIYLNQSRTPNVPFLQDCLDAWPPAGPPAFPLACANPDLLHGSFAVPHFQTILYRAMKDSAIRSPRPSAIAGLFLWWQGSLPHWWYLDVGDAVRACPVPRDLFDALAVPLVPGVPDTFFRWRGRPETRMRGHRAQRE